MSKKKKNELNNFSCDSAEHSPHPTSAYAGNTLGAIWRHSKTKVEPNTYLLRYAATHGLANFGRALSGTVCEVRHLQEGARTDIYARARENRTAIRTNEWAGWSTERGRLLASV